MAVSKEKFRELVFQLLYGRNLGYARKEDLVSLMMAELAVPKSSVRQAWERTDEVLEKRVDIDALIAEISDEYALERIQTVERTILQLGIYELLHDPSIPPKVSIAEAIRLTRKFSTNEAASFVNALLDQVHKQNRGED